MTQWPAVSVIMPVLNEEAYLKAAVEAILHQEYQGSLHVVLALGPSIDATNEVAASLATEDGRITIVQNPTGKTADGLNAAIQASSDEVIVRVDAHTELSPGYIETAVLTLQRTNADNVGGIMDAQGHTPFEEAVAAAMKSPFGVGAASFHTGGSEGPADTVYLGVFKRSAINRVGGYDPHFVRAQDWEMNHRIRQTGGAVWFNPAMKVSYRPRPTIKKLAKQYFEYGTWRREVMRSHPETVSRKSALRYFAPPAAVAGTTVGIILIAVGWGFGWIPVIGYIAIETIAALMLISKAKRGWIFVPAVLLTMHWSWGIGFILSRAKKN